MAAITLDGRQELVALYITMFGTAPSTEKLAQGVTARENGATLFQIAAVLATDPGFALVASKDANSFATYLADSLLAADIPASARAWAINWVITQVSGTKTKAQVIAEAVQAIRATTNPNYASSKAELAVDVTTALAVIDNPPPVVYNLNLEARADNILGTANAEVINGVFGDATNANNTFNVGDSIDAGDGNDTMNLVAQGTTASSGTITVKNVETINIRDVVGATFNASLVENAPAINFNQTLAGQTSTLTGAALASVVGLSGKGNLTVDYLTTTGTADTSKLSLNAVGTSSTVRSTVDVADGNTVEAVTIATTGSNFVALKAGTAAGTVTITGNGTNNIDFSTISTTSTIDASTSTGTNTLVLGGGLSNGDVVKGGTGTDTATFTAATAVGGVTFTGVETLTGVFNANLGMNFGTSTGIKTLNMSNTVASNGSVDLNNVTKELATVNITAQAGTVNDFGLSYKAGDIGALTLNIGGAANIEMDAFTLTRLSTLNLNAVGTKTNNIGDAGEYITFLSSPDVAVNATVGVDGSLNTGWFISESFGDINVSVAESGYFDTSGFSGSAGGIGNITLTVGKNATGAIYNAEASGSIGNITATVGSGASGYIEASAYSGAVSGVDNSVGNINVTLSSGATGSFYADASSGSVGNITLTVGANTSGLVDAYASGFSGVAGSAYAGGGNIGNITVIVDGTSGSASAYASAYIGDNSGNDGAGGNIGNIILSVNGSGASGHVTASGYSGGSVGSSVVTVGESAYAYLDIESDDRGSAGGNVGSITATIADNGYFDIEVAASGSVGNVSVTGGNNVDFYLSGYSNSGSFGTTTVTLGEDAFVSANASGDSSIGDMTITVGENSVVSAYMEADDVTGKITITAGVGSDVSAYTDADSMGTIKITGGSATDSAKATASGNSIDSIDLSGWVGTYTINAGGVIVGTVINTGKANGTVTGSQGADVITGGAGIDTVNGGTGSDVIVGAAGNDILNGEAGNDLINGGSGDDSITGGAGADNLTGGTGTDTFIFATGDTSLATLDTITDYRASGQGTDLINLSSIVAVNGTVGTVQDLSAQATLALALGAAANSNTVDLGVSVFLWGGSTYVFAETTGATTTYVAGDTLIQLTGVPAAAGTTIVGLGIDGI